MFCHLSLGKVFSAVSKTFSVYGWELSSPCSPSSLFDLQPIENKQSASGREVKIILPFFWGYPPHPPYLFGDKSTDRGWTEQNHQILRRAEYDQGHQTCIRCVVPGKGGCGCDSAVTWAA
jgi:hypothetical protein